MRRDGSITDLSHHIDIVQIRNGKIHIVDYQPGARKEKPIVQLMVYALALSRRTGLRLFDFSCSWFDHDHYYEFFPLHVVHKRKRRGSKMPLSRRSSRSLGSDPLCIGQVRCGRRRHQIVR